MRKIKLGHTFEDILNILKEIDNIETKTIIEYYRKKLQPYLGPHPYNSCTYTSGFGFYIATSGHDNHGKPVKECEGYTHLPYEINEIFQDNNNKLDWYDFGISEYFLDKITLDTLDDKIKTDLNVFFIKGIQEYKSYGLCLLNNYEKKISETQEYILKRIKEYRNIIKEFIDKINMVQSN